MTCNEALQASPLLEFLIDQPHVSDSDLTRTAEVAVLSQVSENPRAKSWTDRFFTALRGKESFRKALMQEIERRNLPAAANLAEMTVAAEAISSRHPKQISTAREFGKSLFINGGLNATLLLFFNTYGFIAYAPKIRIFKPENISTDNINELIEGKRSTSDAFYRYYHYRTQHQIERGVNTASRFVNYSILTYVVLSSVYLVSAGDPGAGN